MNEMNRVIEACNLDKQKHLKTQREEYIESRDKIAHVLLKLFGLKPSFLKHITIKNLDSFFAGIGFVIDYPNKNRMQRMYFVYVPEMEKLLYKVRPSYLTLRKFIMEATKKRITIALVTPSNEVVVTNELKEYESEIWSQKMVKNYYVKRLNAQLKKAFKSKKKTVTSYAYKRTATEILTKKLGIKVAQGFLRCSNQDTLRKLLKLISDY